MPEVDGAERLALGQSHSCALKGGDVWCWGESGALGRDLAGKLSMPIPGKVLDEKGEPLTNVVDIAAFGTLTCALDANDEVFCWDRDVGLAHRLPWPTSLDQKDL